MAQVTKYDGVTITDAIEIGQEGQPGYSQTATLGTPGFSTVIVDDPEGTMTFETWKDWTVDEDDCSFERLFTGIVYTRRIIRGPYRDGPGRQWVLEIADLGQLLAQRIIVRGDGNRPAETDLARVAWVLGQPYLDGIVFDNGKVNLTDNPQEFSESDYRGQTPMELLISLAGFIAIPGPGVTSKNAYVYWDEAAGQPSLFYDVGSVPLETATIGFSNVLDDIDGTTIFGPSIDAEQTENGEGRYGGVYVQWRGPAIYRQSGSTIAAMERVRDVAFSSDRIGLATTAEGVAQSLLAQAADDISSIKFSVDFSSEFVNLVRPGMRMEVRFSHMPGYETAREVYVNSTIVQQLQAGEYRVQYDVSPNPHLPTPATGGSPSPLPHETIECDVDNVSIVQSNHASVTSGGTFSVKGASWGTPPTVGNLLFMAFMPAGIAATDAGDFPGWTQIQANSSFVGTGGAGGNIQTYYKIAGASELTQPVSDVNSSNYPASGLSDHNAYLIEIAGVDALDTFAEDVQGSPTVANTIGVNITPTADKVAIIFGLFEVNQAVGFAFPITPGSGITELYEEAQIDGGTANPGRWIGYRIVDGTTGSYFMGGTEAIPGAEFDWGAVAISFICTGDEPDPPLPGQPVPHEVVTMVGDDGTTAFPFADGSLRVFVDNVDETAAIIAQDGAAGTFTLGFTPTPTEVVTVIYQGR